MSEGRCHYCEKTGPRRAGQEDGLSEDMFVCAGCWRLLQKPETALPLIRGDVTLRVRSGPPGLASRIEPFMEMLAGWKPRN